MDLSGWGKEKGHLAHLHQEAGVSWAHRALDGPPGKAEGRAHRHVHPGDTVPASSGHSPGSQDRRPHLGRKQKAELRHSPGGLLGLSLPAELTRPGSAIVLDRPFLLTASHQNQEDKQPQDLSELSYPTHSLESTFRA